MQRIQTDEDVLAWKQSPGYRAFFTWIERRAERIVGKEIVEGDAAEEGCSEVRSAFSVLRAVPIADDRVEDSQDPDTFEDDGTVVGRG
jgi:hypothetical protein